MIRIVKVKQHVWAVFLDERLVTETTSKKDAIGIASRLVK